MLKLSLKSLEVNFYSKFTKFEITNQNKDMAVIFSVQPDCITIIVIPANSPN